MLRIYEFCLSILLFICCIVKSRRDFCSSASNAFSNRGFLSPLNVYTLPRNKFRQILECRIGQSKSNSSIPDWQLVKLCFRQLAHFRSPSSIGYDNRYHGMYRDAPAIETLLARPEWSLTRTEKRGNAKRVVPTRISRVRKVSDPGGSVIERVSGSQNHGAFSLPLRHHPPYNPPSHLPPHTTISRWPPTTPAPPTSSCGRAVGDGWIKYALEISTLQKFVFYLDGIF